MYRWEISAGNGKYKNNKTEILKQGSTKFTE